MMESGEISEFMRVYVIHKFRGSGAPGERERNKAMIARICRVLIAQGHCPISPVHALSDFLDDTDPLQRAVALRLCKELQQTAEQSWVFDYEGSEGCLEELKHAQAIRQPFRFVDVEQFVAGEMVGR